jgi:hypothetical protein
MIREVVVSANDNLPFEADVDNSNIKVTVVGTEDGLKDSFRDVPKANSCNLVIEIQPDFFSGNQKASVTVKHAGKSISIPVEVRN